MKLQGLITFIVVLLILVLHYIYIMLNDSAHSEKVDSISVSVNTTTTTKNTKNVTKTTKKREKTKLPTTNKRTTTTKGRVVRFPIDVNLVTYDELLEIKGVGASIAGKIIDFRSSVGTIYNMDMLLQINGIGETTLADLKQYLYVSDKYYDTMTKTTEPPQTAASICQTTVAKTTVPVTTTPPRIKQKVNINTANAEEISNCLLIDMELAEKIIELRNQISYFSNSLELLYIDGFSEKMHAELKDYIIV